MARSTAPSKALPFVDPSDIDKWAIFGVIGHKPDKWQELGHVATATYRYTILACGVRVGKTHFAIAEVVAQAVTPSIKSREDGEWVGSRIWIVAPNYDLADRVFLPVLRFLKRFFPTFIEGYDKQQRVIYLPGGGLVQAKTAENEDSLVGEELDLLVLEECARIHEEAKEMAQARLLTRRGRSIAISSPTSVKWFMRDFELGQANGFHYEFDGDALEGAKYAGRTVRFVQNAKVDDRDAADYFSIRIPTHSNPRLDVNDLARAERKVPERLFRQDYLAEFVGKTGLVFQNVEDYCLPRATHEVRAGDPRRLYVVGWDPARTTDYSVLSVWDASAKRQVWLDRFRGPWDYQYRRVVDVCYRFQRPFLIIDATGKGDAPSEMLVTLNQRAADMPRGRFARGIEGVTTYSNVEKRALVESFAGALEQGEAKLLDYPEQLSELRLFEYIESDTTKAVRYTAPRGFHDDIVMADALAWRGITRPGGAAKFYIG